MKYKMNYLEQNLRELEDYFLKIHYLIYIRFVLNIIYNSLGQWYIKYIKHLRNIILNPGRKLRDFLF